MRETGTDRQGPTRRARRHGAELESALLTAAWEVLVESGYAGFTYDAIASRAETSRAVLYRRWPQRHLILEAALRRIWAPIDVPDTGILREDAITLLQRISAARGRLMTVLVQDLADYYRETGNSLTDLREIIGVSRRERPFDKLVVRAIKRGEIDGPPPTRRVLDLPLDLLRQDMLVRNTGEPDDVIIEIIDEVWLPLLKH